ncbi:hypothetical protein [Phaffia rhodozyma]|uniref:Uncharacterized protein n=1 Tax=Phaffia rhodozyma TaxID=264483 RepID=A0A0F7SY19_PHARH|nr:hypothetical protein [Phaffia rhodozyma]
MHSSLQVPSFLRSLFHIAVCTTFPFSCIRLDNPHLLSRRVLNILYLSFIVICHPLHPSPEAHLCCNRNTNPSLLMFCIYFPTALLLNHLLYRVMQSLFVVSSIVWSHW